MRKTPNLIGLSVILCLLFSFGETQAQGDVYCFTDVWFDGSLTVFQHSETTAMDYEVEYYYDVGVEGDLRGYINGQWILLDWERWEAGSSVSANIVVHPGTGIYLYGVGDHYLVSYFQGGYDWWDPKGFWWESPFFEYLTYYLEGSGTPEWEPNQEEWLGSTWDEATLPCWVSVSAPSPYMQVGGSMQLSAAGGCPGSTYSWSVTSGPGSVNSSGLYTSSEPGVAQIRADSCWCSPGTVTVKVVKAEVKRVEFTSDHNVMTDWNSNFAGSGGTPYPLRGWIKNGANNPISHTKGQQLSANVTVCVEPSGVPFTLIGDASGSAPDFNVSGLTSNGADQQVSATSTSSFSSAVNVWDYSINWTINISGGPSGYSAGSSGSHRIFVTWGSPGSGPTRHRIESTCAQAMGSGSTQGIAYAMQHYVKNNTTFGTGPNRTHGWELLDGGGRYGDCACQAETMALAVEMLGAGSTGVQYVRASTDGGAGHCLNLQLQYAYNGVNYEWQHLLLLGEGVWNAYEGCCTHATGYYAVTPEVAASNDYTMLQSLMSVRGWQQWWVYCGGYDPDSGQGPRIPRFGPIGLP